MNYKKLAFISSSWPVRACLITAMFAGLPGCALKVDSVAIESMMNANQNRATAVDVVFLSDDELAEKLARVTARHWFAQKPGYLASYGSSIVLVEHELVPGSSVDIWTNKIKNPSPRNAQAVLVFANYQTEDMVYTVDISDFKNPVVTLQEKTISVREKGEVAK